MSVLQIIGTRKKILFRTYMAMHSGCIRFGQFCSLGLSSELMHIKQLDGSCILISFLLSLCSLTFMKLLVKSEQMESGIPFLAVFITILMLSALELVFQTPLTSTLG